MIDIEIIKKHLNVDDDYEGDNALIEMYKETAINQVAEDSGCEIEELTDDNGMLKPIARQAALLLIADFYAYRENTFNGALSVQPKGYQRLINIIRHYD